jgi:DNA-binding transcriptional LysR family regulator
MHALTVLGEAGSYTAAARRLGLSKAAMSLRISELEAAAGVPLVRRTTRSVRLTEAGRQLADSTRPAFASIAEAFAGVHDLAGQPRGLLRLTAPVALARQQLFPACRPFCRPTPSCAWNWTCRTGWWRWPRGLRSGAAPHRRPAGNPCGLGPVPHRDPAGGQPGLPGGAGPPTHPSELARHRCLFYPGRTRPRAGASSPKRRGERVTVGIAGPLAANNSEALREAALAGLGIALLPDFSTRPPCARAR